jgi:glycosyltransferase involved in cell wall biosynthesis
VPTISIITICFNNLQDVIKTCASVEMQVTRPFEHLIIDGSTTPDIRNYLENNPQPPYRRWICEPDKGISDAFNKGIRNAKGDVSNLLNSGDELYDEQVLRVVNDAFAFDPSVMWCHGKLELMRGGLWVVIGKPFERNKLYRGMRGTMHPTMYLRKELYDKYGLFDIDLKMAMDYDLLCRIANEKFVFIDKPLARFDPAGVSSTKYVAAMKEAYTQYRKYYGSSWKQTLWEQRLIFLHHLLQSPVGKILYRIKTKLGMASA